MFDPRVEQITQALFSNQSGGGLDDIRVYMGSSRQVGQGFGDFIRNALRTALKHGGKALSKVIQKQEKPTAAPPLEPPPLNHNERDAGTVTSLKSQTGAGRYKASRKRKVSNRLIGIKRPNVHYNF